MNNFIIIIILAFATNSYAFLGKISECITDPCGCYCSTHHWTWNGVSKSRKKDCNCPPYNRYSGHHGCLKQFDPPGNFTIHRTNICAEGLRDDYLYDFNEYFNPKIKVRMQTCNAASCWTKSKNLKYNGQCAYWVTGYGPFPMKRLCARVALEDDNVAERRNNCNHTNSGVNFKDDCVYSSNHHLNKEGVWVEDAGYTQEYITEDTSICDSGFTKDSGYSGVGIRCVKTEQLILPKICAYDDPGVLEFIQGTIDLLDVNPTKEALHQTEQGSAIVSFLIFILEQSMNLQEMLYIAIPKLLGKIPGLDKVMDPIVKAIEFIYDTIGREGVLAALNEINSLN